MSKNYGAGKYFYKLFIALDQLLNAVLCGYPDETLSSRTYRSAVLESVKKRRWLIAHKFINGLFFWQKDHCYHSYISETERNHTAKDKI